MFLTPSQIAAAGSMTVAQLSAIELAAQEEADFIASAISDLTALIVEAQRNGWSSTADTSLSDQYSPRGPLEALVKAAIASAPHADQFTISVVYDPEPVLPGTPANYVRLYRAVISWAPKG